MAEVGAKIRLFVDAALGPGAEVLLTADQAHYLFNVMRVAHGAEIAVFNGWDEAIAASHLWESVLEAQGYDVNLTYADVAPIYAGLAKGDFDLVLDTWLPTTHADYLEQYGDDIVDLGAWNDEASLTIAVNEDAPIDSLDVAPWPGSM